MSSDFEDKEFTCSLCSEVFVWTSGEQTFLNDLKEKGKINSVMLPKRCPSCREKRRREKAEQEFNSGYPA